VSHFASSEAGTADLVICSSLVLLRFLRPSVAASLSASLASRFRSFDLLVFLSAEFPRSSSSFFPRSGNMVGEIAFYLIVCVVAIKELFSFLVGRWQMLMSSAFKCGTRVLIFSCFFFCWRRYHERGFSGYSRSSEDVMQKRMNFSRSCDSPTCRWRISRFAIRCSAFLYTFLYHERRVDGRWYRVSFLSGGR